MARRQIELDTTLRAQRIGDRVAQPTQELFPNTAILWLAALVLIGLLLRGPLRNSPVILKKPVKFVVASCIALGFAIFLLWNPVQKTAKQSSALTVLWVLFSGLTPIAWIISFFWIFLSRSKQRARGAPVTVGGPAPQTQVQQQQALVRNVPTQRFADVGGLDDAKEQIRQVVQGHLSPGKYERYGLLRNGIQQGSERKGHKGRRSLKSQ
jgi:hypothetical protein